MSEVILSYSIEDRDIESCCESVFAAIKTPGKCWLACFNPHSYVVSLRDAHFKRALADANWLVPDGIGVVMASKLRGGSIDGRVTGWDMFYGVHQRMNNNPGLSVFFLGSSEKTLARIRSRMARDFPNIEVSGTYSPPFKSAYSADELETMVAEINAAQPDVLWVGMTAPKQEKWILDNLPLLNIRFAGAIGAVFDFYAGTVPRPPELVRLFGLEWAHRLIRQPKRLWRRSFISAPIFFIEVFKELGTSIFGRRKRK
jgi:N-acetylglucosaminyldiphosphoundecaprenol N-acetyl-beta-D-mannosaminyltransferase